MAESDDPQECECCGFRSPVGGVKPYEDGEPKRALLLCQICAGTLIGNRAFWPRCYDDANLMKAVGYIGNLLRRDIARLKENPPL